MIYLDHNASTRLDARVLETMMPYLSNCYGNPSTLYRTGRIAKDAVEAARCQVAALINVQPSQVIFTSGGTEANNLAIKGFCWKRKVPGAVAVSAIEHDSVLQSAAALTASGWVLSKIAVDESGLVGIDSLASCVRRETKLISVMMANNETGVIQNVALLSEWARSKGIVFHTDASQIAGKLPIDFKETGVQMLSLSAHKIYGPKGVGALVVDRAVELEPLLHGGGQERGGRSGTENVAAIVGFGRAAELALAESSQSMRRVKKLLSRLEKGLLESPRVVVFARKVARLPNTLQLGVKGMDGEMLLMQLDRKGIEISSGSACSSEGKRPSHVLQAMGIEKELAGSAIRVSLGKDNSEEDVSYFLEQFKQLIV